MRWSILWKKNCIIYAKSSNKIDKIPSSISFITAPAALKLQGCFFTCYSTKTLFTSPEIFRDSVFFGSQTRLICYGFKKPVLVWTGQSRQERCSRVEMTRNIHAYLLQRRNSNECWQMMVQEKRKFQSSGRKVIPMVTFSSDSLQRKWVDTRRRGYCFVFDDKSALLRCFCQIGDRFLGLFFGVMLIFGFKLFHFAATKS